MQRRVRRAAARTALRLLAIDLHPGGVAELAKTPKARAAWDRRGRGGGIEKKRRVSPRRTRTRELTKTSLPDGHHQPPPHAQVASVASASLKTVSMQALHSLPTSGLSSSSSLTQVAHLDSVMAMLEPLRWSGVAWAGVG